MACPPERHSARAPEVRCREGTDTDADAIALLHADSWRRHYRGAYADSYLDGDIEAERRGVWAARLTPPRVGQWTVVAEADETLVGFAHTVFDHDPRWGALLDNLHVRSDRKARGIGTMLLSASATTLLRQRPGRALYLWVLEQNVAAQAFYEARGGTRVGTELRTVASGDRARAHRYAWPDPARLVGPGE